MLGLIPLGAGGALVTWALARHYTAAPGKSWTIDRFPEPEYLLADGPYRITRNPMYLGGIGIWSGWAIWFGSAPVAVGATIAAAAFRAGIAWEEQALGRRWGEEWRAYAADTPRWLSLPSVRRSTRRQHTT